MANTLRITLGAFCRPFRRHTVNLTSAVLGQPRRHLYAKSTLGLDSFAEHRQQVKSQMAPIEAKFREKMTGYASEDSKTMIFTEDLKNMIHLAETDADFALVVKMIKKFNSQNKQLRFGNFVFGPVVMRMFHTYNQPDLAVECFTAPEMEGFFDQLITYQILLDLIYENQKYKDMLSLFSIIKDRQMQTVKYPRNVIVLTMAACYKLNSAESLEFALNLWKELSEAGHFPMRRATTFCAGLVLNQGKPEAALEILGAVRRPNYVTIRNLKVQALVDIGRLDEAVVVLKSIISEDQPDNTIQTFNRDVLEKVKAAVSKVDDPDLSLEYNRLEKLFEKQGNVSNKTLDEQLCDEIQQPPVINNRQQNRFSRYSPQGQRREPTRSYKRPGLKDLV